MTYDVLGPMAPDYFPCRYGTSRLTFRGPARDLGGPYVAFLGGTQTYGKFIEQPYPLRVEHLTGVPSLNLGQINAGPDVFAKDPFVLEAARGARVTVLEVVGAANMSNRLYSVHPRRNDRFVRASPQLRQLYPDVDFAQFNFIRHLLGHLHDLDPERFAPVRRVLRAVWLRKMQQLVGRLGRHVVLLRLVPEAAPLSGTAMPRLVSDAMVAALRQNVSGLVEVAVKPSVPDLPQPGITYDLADLPAVRAVAGPDTHRAAAAALRPVLDPLI